MIDEHALASIQAVVLAAGRSARFAMGGSKLVFPLCGQPVVLYPIAALEKLSIPTLVVTGYQSQLVQNCIAQKTNLPTFVHQQEQRGTGHAVACTQQAWHAEDILIINGDMPLITTHVITRLIHEHRARNAVVSCVVAVGDEQPNGYGKVVNIDGCIQIIEARDFKGSAHEGRLINAGVYVINRAFLTQAMQKLVPHENSQEWYITDIIAAAGAAGHIVVTLETAFDDIRGINTIRECSEAERILRLRIIEQLMIKGVYFEQPETVIIEPTVTIDAGAHIGAGVRLLGNTRVGQHCSVGSYSTVTDSTLADNVAILPYSFITSSLIHREAAIGPFAHVRSVTTVHERAQIGNFVEVSKSVIGATTKVKHLSYVGNALVGQKVNIGAGTITCNYDGFNKHVTTIEDNVKIGSNNALVAPVTVGHDAMTGAGSVITDDVPAYALAIARARQVNKQGYVSMRWIDNVLMDDKKETV